MSTPPPDNSGPRDGAMGNSPVGNDPGKVDSSYEADYNASPFASTDMVKNWGGKGLHPQVSLEHHLNSDVDQHPAAQHHTLGLDQNQAAPGNVLERLVAGTNITLTPQAQGKVLIDAAGGGGKLDYTTISRSDTIASGMVATKIPFATADASYVWNIGGVVPSWLTIAAGDIFLNPGVYDIDVLTANNAAAPLDTATEPFGMEPQITSGASASYPYNNYRVVGQRRINNTSTVTSLAEKTFRAVIPTGAVGDLSVYLYTHFTASHTMLTTVLINREGDA